MASSAPDSRLQPCSTALVRFGDCSWELVDGWPVIQVYGEGFRLQLGPRDVMVLRNVIEAVWNSWEDGRLDGAVPFGDERARREAHMRELDEAFSALVRRTPTQDL